MFFPWIDGIIRDKKVVELLKRARKNNFNNFLFLGVNYLRIEEADLYAGLIKQFHLSYFLTWLKFLLILSCEDFRGKGFLFPESIDDLIGIAILKSWEQVLLFLFFMTLDISAQNSDGPVFKELNFADGIDLYGCLFDDAEHIGDEHEVFLSDIEPAKEGKCDSKDAFVVLKNGLVGHSQVLTDDLSRSFLFTLAHNK